MTQPACLNNPRDGLLIRIREIPQAVCGFDDPEGGPSLSQMVEDQLDEDAAEAAAVAAEQEAQEMAAKAAAEMAAMADDTLPL